MWGMKEREKEGRREEKRGEDKEGARERER